MKRSIVAVLIIMLFFSAVVAPAVFASPRGKSFELKTVSNAICPVDGTPVSLSASDQTTFNGRRIGFCCAACKQKFLNNPSRYSGNIR